MIIQITGANALQCAKLFKTTLKEQNFEIRTIYDLRHYRPNKILFETEQQHKGFDNWIIPDPTNEHSNLLNKYKPLIVDSQFLTEHKEVVDFLVEQKLIYAPESQATMEKGVLKGR